MRWLRTIGLPTVLGLLFITLVVPLVLRHSSGAPITPGPESYESLLEAQPPIVVIPSLHTFLLVGMVSLGVPWMLPIFLSIILFLLLYMWIYRTTRHRTVSLLALVILILSPAFSVLGTHHSPLLVGLILITVSLLLWKRMPYVSAISIFIACINAPIIGLATIVSMLFIASRQESKRDLSLLTGVLAGLFIWYSYWATVFPVPELSLASDAVIFEMGSKGGISIFLLLIALYSLFVPRVRQMGLVPYVIIAMAVTFFIPALIPATTIMLAIVASYGVVHLVRAKWNLEVLRQILHVLLFCLGLFLLIVTMRERVDDQPTADMASTLSYLESNRRPGNVLTLPAYTPLLEYYSHRDSSLRNRELLLSRDADRLYDFLERTGSSHVLITEEMTDTMFTRTDEGILFVLPNTERFVLVQQTNTTKVYYYIPRR